MAPRFFRLSSELGCGRLPSGQGLVWGFRPFLLSTIAVSVSSCFLLLGFVAGVVNVVRYPQGVASGQTLNVDGKSTTF